MRRFFSDVSRDKICMCGYCVDEARKSHKNSLHVLALGKALLSGKKASKETVTVKKSLSHSFCSTNAANEILRRVAMVGN